MDPGGTDRNTDSSTQSSTWSSRNKVWALNPQDSAAWETADIDALEVGAAEDAGSAQRHRLSMTAVMVLYTPSTGLNITTGVGALSITGQTPTITLPVDITTAAGALTLTGYAPTVTTEEVVAPGTGALTITGYAPDVNVAAGDALNVAPGAGTLTLTGYAPSLDLPLDITPSTGTLTILGYVTVGPAWPL